MAEPSKTDRVRARIITGRTFTTREVADLTTASQSVVNKQIREMEALGYKFVQPAANGPWTCTNPAHKPTAADEERRREWRRENNITVEKQRYYRERAKEREQVKAETGALVQTVNTPAPVSAPTPMGFEQFKSPAGPLGVPGFESTETVNFKANGLEATPPRLGGRVEVYAMVMLDDGTLRLGIQNGERRWVADVVAEVGRTP